MSISVTTLALAKKYVNETLIGMGALKGAPCKVKSITKEGNQNIITLEWTDDEGTTRESRFEINDGTPIYTWESNYPYKAGDLAIFETVLYSCVVDNSDIVFTKAHWTAIGSSDGDYNIVDTVSQLPNTFTSKDRKVYFVNEENIFYIWNGAEWQSQQLKTVSSAEVDALFN